MHKANICKCLKCDIVLIDENPQINAKEHELTGSEKEMLLIEDGDGFYWVCPTCKEDGNLIDI